MSHAPRFIEVIVLAPDGRSDSLATLHEWQRRGDGWWGHCKVFQPRGGQLWERVHESRIVKLECCGRFPTGEIQHTPESRAATGKAPTAS